MDNLRIGNFIKEQRRERGLTQKQLADKLHITDRAVSKWERGLSAPDIALLEPLAETLGVSVTELLKGERQPENAPGVETEETVRGFLDYSKSAAAEKLRRFRKRYLSITLYALLLLAVVAGLYMWHSGVLFVVNRTDSPDTSYTATLYDRDYLTFRPWAGEEALLKINSNIGKYLSYNSFPASDSYRMFWSPDSKKLILETDELTQLIALDDGMEADLGTHLSFAHEAIDVPKDAEYRFLQWGSDSKNMLFHYQTPADSGYFWYDYRSGVFSGLMKLEER